MLKNGTTINGTPKNTGRSTKNPALEIKGSKGKKRERTSPSPTTMTPTLPSNSQNHGSGGGGNIYTHSPHGSVHFNALMSFTNQAFNLNGNLASSNNGVGGPNLGTGRSAQSVPLESIEPTDTTLVDAMGDGNRTKRTKITDATLVGAMGGDGNKTKRTETNTTKSSASTRTLPSTIASPAASQGKNKRQRIPTTTTTTKTTSASSTDIDVDEDVEDSSVTAIVSQKVHSETEMEDMDQDSNLISITSNESDGTRVPIASHFDKVSNDSSKTSSNHQEQTVPDKGGKEKVHPLHFGSTTRKSEFLEEFERRSAKKKSNKRSQRKGSRRCTCS